VSSSTDLDVWGNCWGTKPRLLRRLAHSPVTVLTDLSRFLHPVWNERKRKHKMAERRWTT